jgi:hypothetical protein
LLDRDLQPADFGDRRCSCLRGWPRRSALRIDHRPNAAYYQLAEASASDIVFGKGIKELPEASFTLIEMLTKLTSKSKKK